MTYPITWFDRGGAVYVACLGQQLSGGAHSSLALQLN